MYATYVTCKLPSKINEDIDQLVNHIIFCDETRNLIKQIVVRGEFINLFGTFLYILNI